MSTIWQVGGGLSRSPYDQLLIKHSVALIGPGYSGKWSADRSDEEFSGHWVRQFATEPQIGDVILLRIGSNRVVAVGIIASEYQYLEQFDDVHGWSLQHGRRVRWKLLSHPQVFSSRVFGANPQRFSRVNSPEVVKFVNDVLSVELDSWRRDPLLRLPLVLESWEEPPQWLNKLVGLASDWWGMIWNHSEFGELPSEGEMLVHFVIPFFRGLGWPQELLAVQWNQRDLAVFQKLPRLPENCFLVVEAKRLGVGAESALKQGINYAVNLNKQCNVLLTDGIRYQLYDAAKEFELSEYANLVALKTKAARLLERLQYRRLVKTRTVAGN